jgi:putative ABC transport system permease protein
MKNPGTDVLNGLPFASDDEKAPTDAEMSDAVNAYVSELDTSGKAALYTAVMCVPSDDYVNGVVDQNMAQMSRDYIEQQLISSYAAEMGVDPQTVSDYIAGMDDETLFAYVRDAMAKQVRSQYAESMKAGLAAMSADQLAAALDHMQLETWQVDYIYHSLLPPMTSDSTYDDNLKLLGWTDKDSPSGIKIYTDTFENKDAISDAIAQYNDGVAEADKLSYTDYVALLMSSITTIINAISYVLIAFVAISLIVSSIMIGIITYISVLSARRDRILPPSRVQAGGARRV